MRVERRRRREIFKLSIIPSRRESWWYLVERSKDALKGWFKTDPKESSWFLALVDKSLNTWVFFFNLIASLSLLFSVPERTRDQEFKKQPKGSNPSQTSRRTTLEADVNLWGLHNIIIIIIQRTCTLIKLSTSTDHHQVYK